MWAVIASVGAIDSMKSDSRRETPRVVCAVERALRGVALDIRRGLLLLAVNAASRRLSGAEIRAQRLVVDGQDDTERFAEIAE